MQLAVGARPATSAHFEAVRVISDGEEGVGEDIVDDPASNNEDACDQPVEEPSANALAAMTGLDGLLTNGIEHFETTDERDIFDIFVQIHTMYGALPAVFDYGASKFGINWAGIHDFLDRILNGSGPLTEKARTGAEPQLKDLQDVLGFISKGIAGDPEGAGAGAALDAAAKDVDSILKDLHNEPSLTRGELEHAIRGVEQYLAGALTDFPSVFTLPFAEVWGPLTNVRLLVLDAKGALESHDRKEMKSKLEEARTIKKALEKKLEALARG